MGIWNDDTLKYLKENYKIKSDVEIAKEIGCTSSYVAQTRYMLGLFDIKLIDSPKTREYLKSNYGKKSAEEMGKELGCSRSYVYQLLRKYKIKTKSIYSYYKNDMLICTGSIKHIMDIGNLSRNMIYTILDHYGEHKGHRLEYKGEY